MSRNSKQKSTHTGQVRIISGKYKNRKLPVLTVDGLRPTTDRVKETLFNWLIPYDKSVTCLDCFAGSGSLGFEALSRGATQTTFVELNKAAAQQLKKNIQLLSANNTQVINTDISQFLQQPPTPFELVFIDPPFRKNLVENLCSQLEQGWLADQALIYLETEKEADIRFLSSHWRMLKEKITGQVAYRLFSFEK